VNSYYRRHPSRVLHPFFGKTCARISPSIIAALLAVGFVGLKDACAQEVSAVSEGWAKGRILVMPRAGLSDRDFDNTLKSHRGRAAGKVGNTNVRVVTLPEGASETAVATALSHHPHIKFAEVDKRVALSFSSNDPYFSSEWHLTKIGAPLAWDSATAAGVTIAILDTGVDSAHPDLASQITPGWNSYDNNSNTADVHGHGTATAGTAAAAVNNGAGVAGVALGTKIMPMRISDPSGYAYWSTTASAITWAADHGAKVANISFDGVSGSSTVQTAAQYLRNKGGVTIAAAGNNNRDEGFTPSDAIISVSATDSNDVRASWSSYGSFVDVSAPGVGILTTNRNGGYGSWSGTSFSSPIVAGAVALIMGSRAGLTPSQIETALFSTATDLGALGKDAYYGHGRVNVAAAVLAALNMNLADTQAPSALITSPTGGTVKGLVAINVTATDNVGVARVVLLVNGAALATDATAPYQFSWDSTKSPDGAVALVAIAYDAAGNSRSSSTVNVTVANAVATPIADTMPPTVVINSPTNGGNVTGNTQINVSGTDNKGAAGLTQYVYIDNVLRCTGSGGTLTCNWNSRKATPGVHVISAVARDAAGNSASTSIEVFR
jgi:thermitase